MSYIILAPNGIVPFEPPTIYAKCHDASQACAELNHREPGINHYVVECRWHGRIRCICRGCEHCAVDPLAPPGSVLDCLRIPMDEDNTMCEECQTQREKKA
jgi:hypothetical protein